MSICYSYIVSLLFLLLIAHWSSSASLRSSLYSSENSSMMDGEIRYQVPLIRRLRRWSKIANNDEVEIPLNETVLSVNDSDDVNVLNSIVNNTLLNLETIESNSSIIQNLDDLINSTMKYPLLRKDLTELNHTTVSIIEEVLPDNKTDVDNTTFSSIDSQTLATNITYINQVVIDDKNQSISNHSSYEFQSSPTLNETTDQVEQNITTILSDYTTESYNATDDNHTDAWGLLFNDKTETILYNDSLIATTSSSNMSQKDAIITDQETYINDTEIIIIETNQNSNETSVLSPKSIPIPVCDSSCQCSKECPYGFEIVNDTCLCDPPCENYHCFGNDTCIVTDKGQPLCQPENGTKHDRPVRCYQPRDAGYHDNSFRYHNRWYYHPKQDTCHLFVYRGLGGNENNFQSLQECHLECITCAPLPDPGECLGQFEMWYYDNKKDECAQFEYSGCKGNENKFLKKEQCVDTCVNRTLSF